MKIRTRDVGQYALSHTIQQLPYKTECGIFSVIVPNTHLIKFIQPKTDYISVLNMGLHTFQFRDCHVLSNSFLTF
jgi:hypothetical protein